MPRGERLFENYSQRSSFLDMRVAFPIPQGGEVMSRSPKTATRGFFLFFSWSLRTPRVQPPTKPAVINLTAPDVRLPFCASPDEFRSFLARLGVR